MMMQNDAKIDYLWLNLKDLPYFRALLRAVEARFYKDFPFQPPVLDLGCGDGHFATVAFHKMIEVGLDPWRKQLNEALRTGKYRTILQGLGSQMPFSDGYFSTVFSNSVLEHIPDVDAVLGEVSRVLKQGGQFIFCVPNQHFTQNLSISKRLDQLGLVKLAETYRKWFNKISRHVHCDSPEMWIERLDRAQIDVERHWDYFSADALRVLEWGHYFGLPSLLIKTVTGSWLITKKRWNLHLIEKWIRPYYNEPSEQPYGSYTFYVARKR